MSKKNNVAETVGSAKAITSKVGGITAANSNISLETTVAKLPVAAGPLVVAGALLSLFFDD